MFICFLYSEADYTDGQWPDHGSNPTLAHSPQQPAQETSPLATATRPGTQPAVSKSDWQDVRCQSKSQMITIKLERLDWTNNQKLPESLSLPLTSCQPKKAVMSPNQSQKMFTPIWPIYSFPLPIAPTQGVPDASSPPPF